ncbi:MAG TPA: hypothetical protein VFF73_30505 [Planctomycetota bacterium]|nr:hypothetical protein [Planctomycetota bacterium]
MRMRLSILGAEYALGALAALSCAGGCADPPPKPDPPAPVVSRSVVHITRGSVIVLHDGRAYTGFVRVPTDCSDEELEMNDMSLAPRSDVEVVEWAAFKAHAKEYVTARLVRNDYPECDIVEGITVLLERHPGLQFHATFNGGIAQDFYDLFYTDRLYGGYTERRPGRDPIDPRRCLRPLLDWPDSVDLPFPWSLGR